MVPDDLSAFSLKESEKVPGHLICERGIPIHLPPFEEIPVDIFLETEGKAPHECPLVMAQRDPSHAVKRIRDAVDDTHVLHQLFDDTGHLPISDVFYREIRKDIKQGSIRLLQSVPSASLPLAAAWRMRLADLSCCAFNSALTANQRQLAKDFLARFRDKDAPSRDVLEHLHQAVSRDNLHDPLHLGKTLLDLRDRLGLPSCLYLATWQRVNGKWVLKQ